jgi:hypothetical protein
MSRFNIIQLLSSRRIPLMPRYRRHHCPSLITFFIVPVFSILNARNMKIGPAEQ